MWLKRPPGPLNGGIPAALDTPAPVGVVKRSHEMTVTGYILTKNYHQVLRLQQTFGKNNIIKGSIHAVSIVAGLE